MTNGPELRPTVYVEERHVYDVQLGSQIELRWAEGQGNVHVVIPYDGQHLSGHKAAGALLLGTIALLPPGSEDSGDGLPITVPAGDRLMTYLKSGAATVWRATYAIAPPPDMLIAIEGQVFDGAGSDQETLMDLLFERPEAFVNDLYLRLTLWTPNLAARLRPERGQELHDLLLQQENQRQVLLAGVDDSALLARSMAALANTEGGRILIGVGPRAQVIGVLRSRSVAARQAALEPVLLKAALRCEPSVPFSPPDELDHPDGTVIRVLVPKSTGAIYRVDGVAYRRDGSVTVAMSGVSPGPPADEPAAAVGDLKGILAAGSSDDVIVLDGSSGLNTLELGPMICGLINADRRDGLIIIRNVVPNTRTSPLDILRRGGEGAIEQVEDRVRQEVRRIVPRLEPLRPTLSRVDDATVVILHVPRTSARVALYNDQGYEWSARALRPLNVHEVFTRYIQRAGTGQTQRASGRLMRVAYAELGWPIRPPATLWPDTNVLPDDDNLSAYDGQRQAMVWRNCPFIPPPVEGGATIQGDAGLRCSLITPLRHALMRLDQQGVTVSNDTQLKGRAYVQFDDMLASGVGVRMTATGGGTLFANAPVVKTTHVLLRLTIDAGWLFRRRRRASLLSFRLPDLILDAERVAAVRQACADLAFRMDESPIAPSHRSVLLQGLRSKDFYDISLLVGIRHEPESITRELRYEQRTDSKRTDTGMFDVRIALSGVGDDAAGEITRLHLHLQQLISRRLQYLRAE